MYSLDIFFCVQRISGHPNLAQKIMFQTVELYSTNTVYYNYPEVNYMTVPVEGDVSGYYM